MIGDGAEALGGVAGDVADMGGDAASGALETGAGLGDAATDMVPMGEDKGKGGDGAEHHGHGDDDKEDVHHGRPHGRAHTDGDDKGDHGDHGDDKENQKGDGPAVGDHDGHDDAPDTAEKVFVSEEDREDEGKGNGPLGMIGDGAEALGGVAGDVAD